MRPHRARPGGNTPQPALPRLSAAAREAWTGYLFLVPATVLIVVFGLVPVAFALVISLYDWRIKSGTFIGLDNYFELFGGAGNAAEVVGAAALLGLSFWWGRSGAGFWRRATGFSGAAAALALLAWSLAAVEAAGDADFLRSLQVTVWFSLGTVPVQLALGLGLALLLRKKFRGRQAFRALFVLPFVVPAVASAAVFERLFSLRAESFANQVAGAFGIDPLQWLREAKGVFSMLWGAAAGGDPGSLGAYWSTWLVGPSLGLVCIMIYNWWVYVGYYALIFANGLAAIPGQVYEAAKLDGAGPWITFRRITLPLLSPVTYFLTLLGVIGTFKAFNSLYVLRDAATGGATDPLSVFIFFVFFHQSRFGYAAALCMVLLALVLLLTWAQRRFGERHVFYD